MVASGISVVCARTLIRTLHPQLPTLVRPCVAQGQPESTPHCRLWPESSILAGTEGGMAERPNG